MPILNPFYFTVSSFPTLANHQYTYICNLVNKDKFAGQNWILYKFWVGLVNKNWEKSLICNGREAMNVITNINRKYRLFFDQSVVDGRYF